jgi:hypothetical protein
VTEFDIVAHHRERTRRAEQRADGLERHRDHLERLLLVTAQVAAGQDCNPLVLLRAILEMVDTADALPPPGRTIEDDLALLRETDTARLLVAA